MKVYRIGQIIMFDKVWAWNNRLERPSGRLRQFVITKAGTRKEINWYPYLIDSGRYRTVVSIPDKLRIRKCK